MALGPATALATAVSRYAGTRARSPPTARATLQAMAPEPDALRKPVDEAIRPLRSLWLLVIAHVVNHGQAVLLPLVFLRVIDEFHVSVAEVAFLSAIGSMAAGFIQLTFAGLTRVASRRAILGVGGLLFGGGFAAQALAPGFGLFALTNVLSKIGGAPQHPVGNGLLAEQFPPARRGLAISAHIAGGNVGTVIGVLLGAWLLAGLGWRLTVVLFGVPAMLIALGIVLLVRETGLDRQMARAEGSVLDAFRAIVRRRDLLWLYLASIMGGGGRGLGVVNLFALLYLTQVVGVDSSTSNLMYAVLIVFSVPAPLVAGWLSDRVGRKPVIIVVYLAGAAAFGVFLFAGHSMPLLWAGIVLMGAFSFAESPQLQALVADLAPVGIRDAVFAAYFTLAFGVGSLWVALYGVVIDWTGNAVGLPLVFALMAISFVLAAACTMPIRTEPPDELGREERPLETSPA